MNIPVLFIVFNRPETTAEVFEAIRKAQPKRLYISCDGPRSGNSDDAKKIDVVRNIVSKVDWVCEVFTLYHDTNYGCRYAPQLAIDWLFENEPEGVILEDDCLPHQDFFSYCEWALNEFRDEESVWHINGNNFSAPDKLFNKENYAFVSLAQVWGWATWADRWKKYVGNPFYLAREVEANIHNWRISPVARINKSSHVRELSSGLDAWDFQWQMTILNNSGYAVVPASNLISNLGDGDDATHTQFDSRTRLPVRSFNIPERETPIKQNHPLTRWYEKKMGIRDFKRAIKIVLKDKLRAIKSRIFDVLVYSVIREPRPIVVASSGRSGSTMLTAAISRSYFSEKYPLFPATLKEYLSHRLISYVDRLGDITNCRSPIIKTHDVYDERYSDIAKYVYVFGDPLESALSTKRLGETDGKVWVEEHIYHLVGSGMPHELFEKDVLNYEEQLRSWGCAKGVFVVHYDDLWKRVDELSDFIGFEVVLPKKRARITKVSAGFGSLNSELFAHLKQIENEVCSDIN